MKDEKYIAYGAGRSGPACDSYQDALNGFFDLYNAKDGERVSVYTVEEVCPGLFVSKMQVLQDF